MSKASLRTVFYSAVTISSFLTLPAFVACIDEKPNQLPGGGGKGKGSGGSKGGGSDAGDGESGSGGAGTDATRRGLGEDQPERRIRDPSTGDGIQRRSRRRRVPERLSPHAGAGSVPEERVELFRQQKTFLLQYGILDRDFDYDAWIDRRPLEDARRELDKARAA